MAKNDLTSKEWCDLIFQGKNQEYGAYRLRVDSPKRHNWALLIILIVMLLCFSLLKVVEISTPKQKEVMVEVTSLSKLDEPVVVDMSRVSKPSEIKKKGHLAYERTPSQKSAPRIAADKGEIGGTIKKVEGKSEKVKIIADNQGEKEAETRKISSAAASKLVAGAFGRGASLATSGNGGTGTKADGSPKGNSDTGRKTGVGGHGTFNLNGRSLGPGGLPYPSYNVREEGKVVVTIVVNPAGNVISTSINKMTNTVSSALRKAAEDAAKRAHFNSVDGLNNQTGTITYYFKFK